MSMMPRICRIHLLEPWVISVLLVGGVAPAQQPRVAILHFAPQLGQISRNVARLESMTSEAFRKGADIVVAPELATTGYSITAKQIRDSLGLRAPFARLDSLKHLAQAHGAYVVVGIAEIGQDDSLYNSAVTFTPEGRVLVQRKRGALGWNTRGALPFVPIDTRFGRIGVVICSDVYLMDWPRILALSGARLILTPANWWGDAKQLELWRTRAAEDGINMVVANRWGVERDRRYSSTPADTGYVYDMNDSPSAVIASDRPIQGTSTDRGARVLLVHRSNEDSAPHDTVLIAQLEMSSGIAGNPWSLAARAPSAYVSVANRYYRPDLGAQPVPDLPSGGSGQFLALAYQPSDAPGSNLSVVRSLIGSAVGNLVAALLPPGGLIARVDSTVAGWRNDGAVADAQHFVNEQSIPLLITSLLVGNSAADSMEALLLLRAGKPALLAPAIHSWHAERGTGREPMLLDVGGFRVAVVLGRDALVPEVVLDAAKRGADVVLSPYAHAADASSGSTWPADLWLTRSNDGLHVISSGSNGVAEIVRNGGGYVDSVATADALHGPAVVEMKLSTQAVRTKYLNAYTSEDLAALLGGAPALANAQILPKRRSILAPPTGAIPQSSARIVTARPGRTIGVNANRMEKREMQSRRTPILPPGLKPLTPCCSH